ncbi:hypothetical protein HMPREF1320_0074 [Capnocytophaga sp. oral taxon 335 str. F0486]|nr:hypothetical protein HMPREF1320_0074 [Capnocytophaga sp. oral taxon 335 str. F0486]
MGYQTMIEVLETGEPKAEMKNYKERFSRYGYDLPWDEKEFDIQSINEQLIADVQDNYESFKWH